MRLKVGDYAIVTEDYYETWLKGEIVKILEAPQKGISFYMTRIIKSPHHMLINQRIGLFNQVKLRKLSEEEVRLHLL